MYLLKYADGAITFPEALNVSITGIVVVMLILALLAVLVLLLSKAIRAVEGAAKKKAPKEEAVSTAAPTATGSALPDTQSAGKLDLVNVDDKTAAVIMAIVSNESGIPLNRLQFNSIKKIEE